MDQTIQFVIRHGYLLLFFWLFAEQAALPLPSIPLLLACGALGRAGRLELHLILIIGLAACLIADTVWFQLGRFGGARILRLICRVSLEPDSCVRQTENAFLRYGMQSLLVSKFIPGLNAVAAPMAGRSGARFARFLFFDTLGTLLFIGTFTTLGYGFSNQLETVAGYILKMGSGMGALVGGSLAAWIGLKFIQRQRFLRKLRVSRITAEELRGRLQAGDVIPIIDVRRVEPDDPNLIPGAYVIPTEELAERHHEIPRDRDVVLVCS